MKKLAFILILTLSALFGFSVHAASLEEIKKKGEIQFAIDGSSPPFNYYKGKEPAGFEVDFARAVAQELGVKPIFVSKSFSTLLIGIQNSNFDVISSSHAITDARKKVAHFLDPLYCTNAVALVKKGGPKSKSEWSGKMAGSPTGTVYFDAAQKITGIRDVKSYPGETDGIQALLMGKIDMFFTDQFIALAASKSHAGKLETGDTLLKQVNAWVVSKNNESLAKELNRLSEKLMKNGTYSKLLKQHVDADIRCK